MVGVWSVAVFLLIVQLSEFRWLAGTPAHISLANEQLVIDYRPSEACYGSS